VVCILPLINQQQFHLSNDFQQSFFCTNYTSTNCFSLIYHVFINEPVMLRSFFFELYLKSFVSFACFPSFFKKKKNPLSVSMNQIAIFLNTLMPEAPLILLQTIGKLETYHQ